MSKLTKISVLVPNAEARRFEAYCTETGHKKSTLIVRLIREHLDKESFYLQGSLYESEQDEQTSRHTSKI